MQAFEYRRPVDVAAALQDAGQFVAGGTTILDLMKLNVERPTTLIDINRLPFQKVEKTVDGGLKIGALVRNSDLAYDADVIAQYPVLSEALLAGASVQLRNMATTGGNLLQRTRCVYFRDVAMACNKRQPGSGCSAIGGHNRMMAILGTSDYCIAANPSDMNVALTALEATIHLSSVEGERVLPIGEFFVVPGETPQIETVLRQGELITHVALPAPAAGAWSVYLKVRDRAACEFALVSAAVVVSMVGQKIKSARVAMGGVGTKPWRCLEAEKALAGQTASVALFASAAMAELKAAQRQSENGFKVELGKRCLLEALLKVTN